MDAGYTKRRRESEKSRREKRWSMNSQRLEEIVAQLMKPVGDYRRSFDTDLCALLEEYLTEAGLHALEAADEEAVPNYPEVALLLQQSVCIYSRKVDCLYDHVLSVNDSLHSSAAEAAAGAGAAAAEGAEGAAGAGGAAGARRRRGCSAGGGFLAIEPEPCAGARREPAAARPPPTLPRMYIELEPRVLLATDAPLLDYAAEPIGLLADFQVAWRLMDGMLVDELDGGSGGRAAPRAVPLAELQAAIASAAPPSPPPSPPPCASPGEVSAEEAGAPAACSTPLPCARRDRKRRSDVRVEDLVDVAIKLQISLGERARLQREKEFSVPGAWVARVVAARARRVLARRRVLRAPAAGTSSNIQFRGFDITDATDIGGFAGWQSSEAAAARAAADAAAALAALAARRARRGDDSDDDGFFEQSSLGDSDDSAHHTQAGAGGEWAAWRERVVARAAAAEARGAGDVRAAGRALLRVVRALPDPAPARALLAAAARDPADVSRVLLATLFLANAGNVEVVQGPPLTVNSFSVRYVTDDERLYRAAPS